MVFARITAVLAKLGMKNISSDVALTFRTFIVFLIVLVNGYFLHNALFELKNTSKTNLLFLAISGITAALSWMFYFRAIKMGEVSFVTTIDKASIIITLILSFIIFKEPITTKIILGAGFILIGTIILLYK